MKKNPRDHNFRTTPIPDQSESAERRNGFRHHPIDATDSRYIEPLLDLLSLGLKGRNYYHRADNPPYYLSVPGATPELKLRSSVAKKLGEVDSALRVYGLELLFTMPFDRLPCSAIFTITGCPQF